MKNNKRLLVVILILVCYTVTAQVAINTDGSPADNSAMLDVKSTSKGVLFPRLTTAQIVSVSNPTDGLTVYNTDEHRLCFYNGGEGQWMKLNCEPLVGSNSYSLSFNGTSSTIDLGYISEFNTSGNATIEAWVKPVVESTKMHVFVLGGNGHLFLTVGSNNKAVFTIVLGDNIPFTVNGTTTLQNDTWYHICGMFDNDNNKALLYVNGQFEGELSTDNLEIYHPNSQYSNIGSYYQPFYTGYYEDKIAGVHLSQEIRYTSNFTPEYPLTSTANTIGLWLLNEGSGTTATDSYGSHNGSIQNGTWVLDVPEL